MEQGSMGSPGAWSSRMIHVVALSMARSSRTALVLSPRTPMMGPGDGLLADATDCCRTNASQ